MIKSILKLILLTIIVSSCKKDSNHQVSKAIIGKWFWEKQEYKDHTYTDFGPINYFSFDEQGNFIEFNGQEVYGTYKLSAKQDSLYTYRKNYNEVRWIIKKLNQETLVIENPGAYIYTLSKKSSTPNTDIEIEVNQILKKGTVDANIVLAQDAVIKVYTSIDDISINKPIYQAKTNSQGKAKIRVTDRILHYVIVSKGNAIMTTDGYLIEGIVTAETLQSYYYYVLQPNAKIGDLIKKNYNGDSRLDDIDKQAYESIWSGKKDELKNLKVYISE